MASLGTLVVNLGANTAPLAAGLNSASSQVAAFASRTSRTLGSALKIGGGVAAGAAAAGVGFVALAADAERTAVSLEVLLGSASEAERVILTLRGQALESPFNATDLIRSAETLSLMGVSGREVTSVVAMLSQVSAGSADKLERLSLAFGQMSAAGRLMGQDLLQMVNAGFNPLQEISRRTGESMVDLKARMEDGAISAAEVTAAFKSATLSGGRFFGMNERMSKTTIGLWQRFTEQMETFARMLGNALLPTANKVLEWANSFGEQMTEAGAVASAVIGNLGLLFKTMWETVVGYTSRALEWLGQASLVASNNIAAVFLNMIGEVQAAMQQLGEVIAFNLGLSDEIMAVENPAKKAIQPLPAFQAPELGAAGKQLAQEIAGAVGKAQADQQKQRELLAIDGLVNDAVRTPPAGEAAKQAGAMQRGSAEAFTTILANTNRRGGKSPEVNATEKQTKDLLNGFKQILPSAFQVAVVESFA